MNSRLHGRPQERTKFFRMLEVPVIVISILEVTGTAFGKTPENNVPVNFYYVHKIRPSPHERKQQQKIPGALP